MVAINAQFPATQPHELVAVDAEQLLQVCRQLQRLFAEDDPRAGKLFDEQAELLRSAFTTDYAALAAAVRGFDFEQALALLQAAAGQRQLTL